MADSPTQDEEVHFNGLTPAEAERLALLAEECGELVQAIGKVLRHGYESRNPHASPTSPTNRQSVEREVGDVYTAIRLMFNMGDITRTGCARAEEAKQESLSKYLHHNKAPR